MVLGLPAAVRACLFDLDGVLTRTATVHFAAWKQMFDAYLRGRAERTGGEFVPFEQSDYNEYVDGMPREDGVRTFLRSRGIELPEGEPGDPPERETVNGLATRKNALVLTVLHDQGVEVYDGSVRYVHALRDAGYRRAVVSASANCRDILAAAGIEDLFEVRVDGIVTKELGLHGKPAPDTFLEAARRLGLGPEESAVFEDATAGVAAGRAGHFAHVVGVDRLGDGHGDDLRHHGADVVVDDLAELLEP